MTHNGDKRNYKSALKKMDCFFPNMILRNLQFMVFLRKDFTALLKLEVVPIKNIMPYSNFPLL